MIIEKIRKRLSGHFTAYITPFLLVAILWTSCSEEQLFPGNARMKMAFRLTSPNALGGSIIIQEAYLKLEEITVTGRLGDMNTPEANYPISPEDPPYRLTQGDTARVSLTLPTRVYDQMDAHLFLLQTDYKLIVHRKTSDETPPPADDKGDEPDGGDTDPNSEDDGGTTDGDDQNDGEQEHDDDRRDEDDDDDDEDDRDDDDGDHKHDDDHDDDKKNKGNDKNKKGGDDDDEGDDDEDRNEEGDDDEEDDDDGNDDRTVDSEVDVTVDLDHFFQHAKPSLVVFATWTFNGENINVVFAVTDVEKITIRATQNGAPQIRVGEHSRSTVNFDPVRWFESISTTDLQNASVQNYHDQPVMFIHRDVNSALFETLLRNLTGSTTFEVAASSDQ